MYDKNGFIQLDSNHADRGSAIYLYKSVLNIEERNSNTSINDKKIDIYLTNNHASIAGTIYWIYDNDIMRSTPNVGNIKFIKNQASYGNQMATQAVNITGEDIYEIINYDKFIITALDFKAFDYYGQALENIPDDSFSFSASITTKHQCLGRTPTITSNEISYKKGIASFENLQVTCAPNGSLSLNIKAVSKYLIEVINITKFNLETNILVKFRACQEGEIISQGAYIICQACAEGTYSLVSNVTLNTYCKYCGSYDQIMQCEKNVINLNQGNWRSSRVSDMVYNCEGISQGCDGGVQSGDQSCREGYHGTLCGSCAEGYYSANQYCLKCSNQVLSIQHVALISIAIIIAFALIYHILAGYLLRYRLYNQFFSELTVQLKIVIATFQIVANSTYALSVNYPYNFGSFSNLVEAFNIDILSVIPFQCSFNYR